MHTDANVYQLVGDCNLNEFRAHMISMRAQCTKSLGLYGINIIDVMLLPGHYIKFEHKVYTSQCPSVKHMSRIYI